MQTPTIVKKQLNSQTKNNNTGKPAAILLGWIAALSLATALILTGCASVGQNFDDNKVSQIRKGESTEADLVALFGPPSQRTTNSEGRNTLSWNYHESETKGESFIPYAGAFMGGHKSRNKTLTVILADGKVASYTYSGGGMETRGTKQDVPK